MFAEFLHFLKGIYDTSVTFDCIFSQTKTHNDKRPTCRSVWINS